MNIDNQSCLKLMWGDRNQRKSNLPFQICLYINLWLCPAWFFINVISLDTKYHSLTNVYKGISVAVFLILFISESFKLYLGYLGNLAGKIPELACCWLILTFVQLPLEMFVLFDRTISPCYSEMFISSLMVCLLLIEIITDWRDPMRYRRPVIPKLHASRDGDMFRICQAASRLAIRRQCRFFRSGRRLKSNQAGKEGVVIPGMYVRQTTSGQ